MFSYMVYSIALLWTSLFNSCLLNRCIVPDNNVDLLQVDIGRLYLSDDRNLAMFPDDYGVFTTLTSGGHYEVQGVSSTQPCRDLLLPSNPGTNSFQFQQRPLTAATATSASSFRRPSCGPKTFQRLLKTMWNYDVVSIACCLLTSFNTLPTLYKCEIYAAVTSWQHNMMLCR